MYHTYLYYYLFLCFTLAAIVGRIPFQSSSQVTILVVVFGEKLFQLCDEISYEKFENRFLE